MRLASAWLLSASLAFSACDSLPRDPEGTSEQIRQTSVIRLGWVDGAPKDPQVQAALRRLARETDARIDLATGDSETLLEAMADGKIDLVYGKFAMDSPWHTEIHLGRAIGWRAEPPAHVAANRFAMRNGENGWIMTVDRATQP